MIAAQSGKRKSLFNTNLIAKELMEGNCAGLINLEMPEETTRRRLTHMLLNHPAEDDAPDGGFAGPQKDAHREAMDRLKVVDFSRGNRTPASVVAAAAELIHQGCRLVVVDSLERAAPPCGGKADLVAVINALADLAHSPGVCIVATSQIKVSGALQEVLHPMELAFAGEKEHDAGQVLCLGERHPGCLDTLCMTKARDCGPESESAFRFVVTASLRMEVLPVDDGRIPLNGPAVRYNTERCGEIPGDFNPQDEDPIDPNDILPGHPIKKGHIQVGREVASSPMFRNREERHVFWLLDLYFCAHFKPGSPVKTPRSKITVTLNRGQYFTTEAQLMDRWCANSRGVVRRFLDSAIREGLISMQHVLSGGELTAPLKPSDERSSGPTQKRHGSVITLLHYGTTNESGKKGSEE